MGNLARTEGRNLSLSAGLPLIQGPSIRRLTPTTLVEGDVGTLRQIKLPRPNMELRSRF